MDPAPALASSITSAVVTGSGCLLFDTATQTTSLCHCEDAGICPVALARTPPCLN